MDVENNKRDMFLEEEENMAILAKDNNIDIRVKQKDAKKFIQEINNNKISEEFLKQCMESDKLFKLNKVK